MCSHLKNYKSEYILKFLKPLAVIFKVLILFNSAVCQTDEPNHCTEFTLKISVLNKDTGTVRLFYWGCNNLGSSAEVNIKNGNAMISGKANSATEALLFTDLNAKNLDDSSIIRFILQPGDISLKYIEKKPYPANIEIQGSAAQKEKEKWIQDNKAFLQEEGKYDSLILSAMSYIRQRPSSYLSGYLLRRYIRKIPIDSSKLYYALFKKNVQECQFGKDALEHILRRTDDTTFRKTYLQSERFLKLSSAKSIYDFSFPDQNGNSISLSRFKGKVMVLNLWASWCDPCIRNVPNFKKMLSDAKNDPVNFVSISTDGNENNWKKAINYYRLPGTTLIDDKGIIQLFYNLPLSVPRYIIIDAEGKVINMDAPSIGSPEFRVLLKSLIKN